MKLTAQEELGLRCMVHMARAGRGTSVTTVGIADDESLTPAYVAKLMRILRKANLVESTRGQQGGYRLTRSPEEIPLKEILGALGGPLFAPQFCARHAGRGAECVHVSNCSIRSLWADLDGLVQDYLSRYTLSDMLCDDPDERGVVGTPEWNHQEVTK